MALLGSIASVKALLRAVPGGTFSVDDDSILTDLQKLVTALIEFETGAVFGAAPTSETLVIESPSGATTLYLPKAAYAVTTITEAPEWSGSAWSGGTVVTTPYYRLAGRTLDGLYRTILGVGRGWSGIYTVTGTWENQIETVPADLTDIANFMMAELYKKRQASPAGFIGTDGAVVPVRDVLKESEVRKTLEAHRVGVGMWF